MESVAVVGGGIGGLAAAIFLSRKGFSVTIYDKAKQPQPVGAGFLLQPPGQSILSKLDVLDEVSEHSVSITGLQSKTRTGRTLLNLKYTHLNGSARNGLGVQRSTIYEALVKQASQSALINFVWDGNVDRVTATENSVSVETDGSARKFDLCILSSGSNSQLADACFPDRIKRPYGWGCLWTTFELPQTLSPNVLHQRCERASKMMGILPVRYNGKTYEAALYWSMKSAEMGQLDHRNFTKVKDQIMDFWPESSQSLAPLDFNHFISANYNDIWTPKPYNGRIIAIGDVSHATSPQLGQGCTMALLDAWSLAMHVTKDDGELEPSLQNWWKSRRYQLAYVRHLSRFLTPLFQSENKLCEVFRDWVMAPVGRLPLFYNMQLKTLASDVFLTRDASFGEMKSACSLSADVKNPAND